jgi:oligopeptide transport system substrate-binding protein
VRALPRALLLLTLIDFASCSGESAPTASTIRVGTALAADQSLARTLDTMPHSLDPALVTDSDGSRVIIDLFEGLTANAPDGSIIPGIASSWEVSPDGRAWTFHLRPGARWSNGDALTAADFIYAWRHQVDPNTGSENAQELTPIVNATEILSGHAAPEALGVEAPDPYTIHIALTVPTPYLLDLLADAFMMPLPRAALERYGDDWTRPEHMVCSGPFMLKELVIGNRITLVKNPNYWAADTVHLQRVTYYPLDRATQPSRFMAGDVQYTSFFSPQQYRWLKSQLGDQVQVGPYLGIQMLAFNMLEPPFAGNRDLRLALSMAVDRQILSDKVRQGVFPPAYAMTPPLPGFQEPLPDWASWSDERRHAEARRLYAAAGYSASHPLKVELVYGTEPTTRDMMDALAAMWRVNLGAQVEPYNEEFGVMLQDLALHKAKLFWSGWTAGYPDPYTFEQLYKSGYAQNFGAYSEPHFDALLAAASIEPDNSKRYRLLEQSETLLNAEAPYIPLLYYSTLHLIKPYVKGVPRNTMDIDGSRYIYILEHEGH